ncbi:MAG: ABC transporter permease, partial [Hyphomicrobiaceae bacterium]
MADDKSVEASAATVPAPQQPSENYKAWLRGVRRRRYLILVCQAVLLILFLVLWEIAPRANWVNPMLTSTPSAVWNALFAGVGDHSLMYHTWITLQETIIGFVISMVLGIGVAVALWWWDFLYRVLDPFMVVANALPKIALAPIFYIWLGDTSSIYANAVAIAVFITILMIYAGFRETNP